LVLSGTVFAVHHFQRGRIARALLWQARRAEEQGQTQRMTRYLQRYLEFNPADREEKARRARAWAGEACSGSARHRNAAARLLNEVLSFEDDPELRRLLIKVALELRDYKLARDQLEKLLRWSEVETWMRLDRVARAGGNPPPEEVAREDRRRGELEGYWAQLLEAEGKPAQAIDCY